MEVNLIAVLIAAILGMVIGMAWYSRFLFGTMWMKLVGMTPEDLNKAKEKGMGKTMALAFVAQIIFAYVLAYALMLTSNGYGLAVMLWLGFIATTMLNGVLWENKPWKLYGINVGMYLVVIVVMTLVLTLMG